MPKTILKSFHISVMLTFTEALEKEELSSVHEAYDTSKVKANNLHDYDYTRGWH